MSKSLRVLIIADSDERAAPIVEHLASGGYEPDWQRAESEATTRAALEKGQWDIVMVDWDVSGLEPSAVTRLADESECDLPVIVLADAVDESVVYAAMEAGVHGLVTRDNMGRLMGAIEREMAEAAARHKDRQASEALAENERFMASIFTSIQDGLSILDRGMRIVRVNPSMEKWYAHAIPLVGKYCYEAYHGRTEPCVICPTVRMLATGEAARDIVPMVDGDGDTIGWIDLHTFPLRDAISGEINGAIEYVRDITAQKRAQEALRESEEHFRLLVQNCQDLLYRYQLKPARGFQFVSPSATDITGYTPEEHYADPDIGLRIFHPDDVGHLQELMKSPEDVKSPATVRFVKKDGRVIWMEQRNLPIYDKAGELVAIEGVARDVTDRVQLEQLKEDLVSMVSHELRTPLASILGYASLLTRPDIAEPANEELFNKAVGKIQGLGMQMNALVEDLLEATRVQSGTLELALERIDIGRLVQDCVGGIILTDEHSLSVDVAKDLPPVMCDPARLSWAVSSIVANAVKFSPEGGAIDVAVRSADARVRITVHDAGIGIEPDMVPQLFERFSQADMSATRPFGGFGMGLFTAKAVVEAHGGRIEVQSEPGMGSSFSIEIPVDRPNPQATGPS